MVEYIKREAGVSILRAKGKCMKSFEITLADDFCSYDERREDT